MTIDKGGIGVSDLERSDLEQLERAGISRAEAERQLRLLTEPPPPPKLLRPCRIGDGIRRIEPDRERELAARGRKAAAAGRISKFVPASGAASRMFHELIRALDSDGEALGELVAQLERFAFHRHLKEAMRASGVDLDACLAAGDRATVVRYLLETPGLGYRELPKGLLDFHLYEHGSRTAFEEHLIESIPYVRDSDGLCRLHFTVSDSHRPLFMAQLERLREPLRERYEARFEVTFSAQSTSTDTLAVDFDNRPFRQADGRLLLRPGGHGALLRNLAELEGDIVLVKNIDNVVAERYHDEIARWKRLLAGCLIDLQERIFGLLDRLEAEPASASVLGAGFELLASELEIAPPTDIASAAMAERRRYLIDQLDRPLRVCGVVRNEGEPGGGPFWVAGEATPQIVERSQIDTDDDTQRSVLEASTHFNPVDLACGVRDRHGRPFDLDRFVDPEAVFISRKSLDGRRLRALELPGLWNGAMARWNTVLVEVPLGTFVPVKTVFDLLRPAHQPEPAP